VFFLPATRFPFDWNSGTNVPQWITSTGTRTPVTNTYHFVYFVYITQDPKVGTAISIVSAPAEYSNITNARAVSWTDIQNTYTYLNDGEIRPLYKLIFEYKTSYDVGTKYSALREIADLRKAAVTSTTVASGSIPASSVTVIPTGDIASTNVQSALAEIDSEKQTKRSLLSTTLPINVAETTLSGASFIPPITSEPLFFNVTEVVGGNTIIQHDVIDRCVVNGGYYDVIITPLVDAITVAKVTVLV